MKRAAKLIREEIGKLERQLEGARQRLVQIEKSCAHRWQEEYAPVVRPAYTHPGRPGQGSHPPIPPRYVPEEEKPRWKRTCQECGKVEYTKAWRNEGTVSVRKPVWQGNRGYLLAT